MVNMNEQSIVEEIISEVGVLSPTPYKEITLLAKYYREKGCSQKESEELIFLLLSKKLEHFLKAQWEEVVEKRVKKVFKDEKSLIKIDKIYVTEEEVELLHTLDDRKERKLLFTLMCLARFNNLCYENSYNKVYNKSSEVIKLSNIRGVVRTELNKTYYSLRIKGLIDFFGKGEESNKIVVKCLTESDNVAFEIFKLENLGNLIESELKIKYDNSYKRCVECGTAYKPKNNRNKYCTSCAKEVIKEKDRLRKSNKS